MAPMSAATVAVPLPGTKVWIQDDSSTEWVKGQVTGQDGELLVVSTAKGERRVSVSAAPMQNSDDEPVEVSWRALRAKCLLAELYSVEMTYL